MFFGSSYKGGGLLDVYIVVFLEVLRIWGRVWGEGGDGVCGFFRFLERMGLVRDLCLIRSFFRFRYSCDYELIRFFYRD